MAAGYAKTIICLANSRKISGRCIAGKEIGATGVGGWVRPVSAHEHGELSELDRRYQDGTDPKLLDVISVPMAQPSPHGYQVENHQIDPKFYWTKVRAATQAEIAASVDNALGPLWDNHSSSYNGSHDRLTEEAAAQFGRSLRLISVTDLQIVVGVEGAEFGNGKRRVRGHFSLNGMHHLLSVSDPVVERQYLAGQDGTYNVGVAKLCISLGEPYQGYAYKLIAGVLL